MASATSKKTELQLTGVAKASLEELRLDYEDFLRQRGLPLWDRNDPRRVALIAVHTALLDRQMQSRAQAFEREGGFTERLHRVRQERRGSAG